jgi:quinol monooxygenase YgiN
MTIIADDSQSSITEVIKLSVKPENLQRMMDYVQEWHTTVIPTLPGFQKAALLSSSAGAVFVYANWSSQEAMGAANHDPRMIKYFEGLIPLLADQPEVHICSVGMIAEAEQ